MSEQIAALMQTIPGTPGTEVVIESTAAGYNDFYKMYRKAESGIGDFIAVFLPWSLDPGYRTKLPPDFEMTSEEKAIAELHKLDAEQILWRRNKIVEFGDENLFRQEYPLDSSECWMSDSFESYIPSALVTAARQRDNTPSAGYLILGVDPAGRGADHTAIAWRKGSCVYRVEKYKIADTMQTVGLITKLIREEKPSRVNIDTTGMGIGIFDRLVEQGYGDIVNGVNFSGKPTEPPPLDEQGRPLSGPANRRSEMYGFLRKALEEGQLALPDSNSLHGDICGVGYKYNSAGLLLLESKEDLRKRLGRSPDEADSVALCFAEAGGSPVPRSVSLNWNRKIEYPNAGVY